MKRALFLLLVVSLSARAFADENLTSEHTVPEQWSGHIQSTVITQYHGPFNAPYSGNLSLNPNEETKTSLTTTLFLGASLWKDASFYIDPELSAGSGLSDTHGVAGFPNGEIYRVDSSDAKEQISRFYYQQIFGFGGDREKFDPDKNQLAGSADISRLTVILGKFSLNDYFDNNTYSHDPRTQFFNWALMDNAAWDYAADTRGYTWGLYLEFNQPHWSLRVSSVLEPFNANQLDLQPDPTKEHGDNAELELRYDFMKEPGKARILYYVNHAHMGSYAGALAASPVNPDVTTTRDDRTKYGFGLNLEQKINEVFGLFSRLGWDDGATETWAFTEADSTLSLGVNIKGSAWKRDNDNIGLAVITNGLSNDHLNYLKAGGYGFIIGDGNLNYGREQIFEIYYLFSVFKVFSLTADYQFVSNPAYNQDRGPVSIIGGRGHLEF